MSTQVLPQTGAAEPRTGPAAGQDADARPSRSLVTRWLLGWCSLTLLVTSIFTAAIAVVGWSLVVASISSIPAAGIGIVMLVPTLWLCGVLGHAERHRVAALTGQTIHPPASQAGQPLWKRLFLDAHSWKSVGYLVLHTFWGAATGAVALAVLAHCLLILAMPLYAGNIPDDGITLLWAFTVDGAPALITLWLLALITLLALPALAAVTTMVDVTLARWLLGRSEAQQVRELAARVDTLTESRAETVDSVEAERRRIERDLHDGPQQRLVAIAMSLGMAKEAIRTDPDTAAELVDEAHTSAKEAIVEMRHVARGIVPPVLSDRGLDAALSALAARSPVPVDVDVRDVGRVDPTVEAIAYFVVSEALTNVAKHSGADRATVDVGVTRGPRGQQLAVTITDDGRGGADPMLGTGLTGLRQRVGSIDGDLRVSSPEGGPTTLAARLPLRENETRRPGNRGPQAPAGSQPPTGARPEAPAGTGPRTGEGGGAPPFGPPGPTTPGATQPLLAGSRPDPNDPLATRYLRPGRSQ